MKYKVGDKLVIIDKKHGHQFNLGIIVEVIRSCGDHYDVCNKTTGDCWYVEDDEVKLFIMKEMTDAVISAAKKLIKSDGEVITTDIKLAVVKTHKAYHWTYEIVEAIMNDSCKAGLFKCKESIVKGDSHFVYSNINVEKPKKVKTPKPKVVAATKKEAAKKTPKKAVKKAEKEANKSGNVIGKKAAHELMKNNKGHFFTATFIDKKNEERVMNCQYLKDQENSELGYVKVREAIKAKLTPKDTIRSVNLQTLKSLKIAGNSYKIK